jgi:hypothetical protein
MAGEFKTFNPFMHHNCSHNQLAAVMGRVIADVPRFDRAVYPALRRVARAIARRVPKTTNLDVRDVGELFSGKKRVTYQTAADQLVRDGPSHKDARYTAFVKADKLNPTKVDPDPRMIQHPHPKYNVELMSYLKPMEHAIYALCGDGIRLPPGRLVGKGLSPSERARELDLKWRSLANPVVIVADMSRFDRHVSQEVMRLEHSVYSTSNPCPRLKSLLAMQLKPRVRTAYLSYVCHGRRMSGVANTALGNVLVMLMVICATLTEAGVPM